MTRNDIVKMAREAGISKPWDQEPINWDVLAKFADLVALAERKRTWLPADWLDYEKNIAAIEREACAKVCDSYDVADDVNSCDTAEGIAIAIRARRQA